MPIVTVRIQNDLLVPTRIAGIVVEFYDTGAVFQTSGTTDVNGEVTATLPIAEYDILMYKPGVSVLPKQPQRIDVLVSPPNSNIFLVTAHERLPPESINAERCTVSGYIKGVDGLRTRSRINFCPVKEIIVLESGAVAPHGMIEVASDNDGYFEFELLRGVCYKANFVYVDTLFGLATGALDVQVPDQAGIKIETLLFPLPIGMDFSANVLALAADNVWDDSISYTIAMSDGSSRSGSVPWASVMVESSDPDVLEVDLLGGLLQVKPKAAGVATITAIRTISSFALFTDPPAFVSESVVVTVT